MSYKQIRSLARGVAVLRHLNGVGSATTAAIAEGAGLPRPTVHRILETLVEQGLIYHSPSANNVYRLTGHVLDLSEGFRDEQWIATAGRTALESLALETGCTANLGTLQDDDIVIQGSVYGGVRTRKPRISAIGQSRAVLGSALGRAYLAFCRAQDQRALLTRLWERREEETHSERDSLQADLATIRREGYALRHHDQFSEIAVPIIHDGQVLGCISVEWPSVSECRSPADLAPLLERARWSVEATLPSVLS